MSNWGINIAKQRAAMAKQHAELGGVLCGNTPQEFQTPPTPKRPPEIVERLNNLQQSIALLEETTDLLRERMLPTLRSEPPDDRCRAEKESREATTPLGTELYHFTNRVNNVATQLRDLLNRCEL
ncbi:hypothetical protein FJY94_06570 [Candidatus Kaiserbacteria bacterium]|nr:hypothetical protein [Candidatus Kaiserbacteria bacterium]